MLESPEEFPEVLACLAGDLQIPGFLPELARLEQAINVVESTPIESSPPVAHLSVNPHLFLLRLSWRNLTHLVNPGSDDSHPSPEPGEEYVLVWLHLETRQIRIHPASNEDLLVLKMVTEEIPVQKAAADCQVPVHAIGTAIDFAVSKGLLLAPPSRIQCDSGAFVVDEEAARIFSSASVFTLQWHITQACDLHCLHCYDRSNLQALSLSQALAILNNLFAFCRDRQVRGQVSFTGGNPTLYPHFIELYRAASDRGFSLAILGNPVPRERLDEMIAIERPVFYQVSLEGLPEHNDFIRGRGHFQRVLEFLSALRDLEIYSMVMLTLTRDNFAQVLPLAEILRDRTDLLTFNRLSRVGEGAKLELPSKHDYVAFLDAYIDAARDNPVISAKDNLINIAHYRRGWPLSGGCTGFGCGAAFNFLCVLADGNVHACRKFPSPIGSVLQNSIGELYDSDAANSYRAGCRACQTCVIRPACGGCLAVAYSLGLDVFEERDPYCFMND
jgi:selenobiotic family peptide radical SAM maturase